MPNSQRPSILTYDGKALAAVNSKPPTIMETENTNDQ
jgi:hypothetical protein